MLAWSPHPSAVDTDGGIGKSRSVCGRAWTCGLARLGPTPLLLCLIRGKDWLHVIFARARNVMFLEPKIIRVLEIHWFPAVANRKSGRSYFHAWQGKVVCRRAGRLFEDASKLEKKCFKHFHCYSLQNEVIQGLLKITSAMLGSIKPNSEVPKCGMMKRRSAFDAAPERTFSLSHNGQFYLCAIR